MTLGLCTVCSLRARTLPSQRDNSGLSVELVITGRTVSPPLHLSIGSYTGKATPAMADINPNLSQLVPDSALCRVKILARMSLSVRNRCAMVTYNAPMQFHSALQMSHTTHKCIHYRHSPKHLLLVVLTAILGRHFYTATTLLDC